MANRRYAFVTEWTFEETDIEEVFAILIDMPAYPTWWEDFKEITVTKQGPHGGPLGNVMTGTFVSRLRYTFRTINEIVECKPPHTFTINLDGDSTGFGRWELEQRGADCYVKFIWELEVNQPIIRFLTPLLRGLFNHEHDLAMSKGYVKIKELIKRNRLEAPSTKTIS